MTTDKFLQSTHSQSISIWAVIQAAIIAGQAICDVYKKDFSVQYKEDASPLTEADRQSHQCIVKRLSESHPGIPILSEEGRDIAFAERSKWSVYWCVDPLDGTKEFIKRNGEFTVNIALMIRNQPALGVIFAPVKNVLYFNLLDGPAYKWEAPLETMAATTSLDELLNQVQVLPITHHQDHYVVMGSRSHATAGVESFIEQLQHQHATVDITSAGSSLKFCFVADGSADCYPRFGPTMEWDTAAGHAIAIAAGCHLRRLPDLKHFSYNKDSLLNPGFILVRTATDLQLLA